MQPQGPPRARRGPRGATRLDDDLAFQALLASLSRKIDALIQARRLSIARYAAEARVAESALQAILKTRSDPKLSTLYTLGRVAGCQVYILFEPDGRRRAPV